VSVCVHVRAHLVFYVFFSLHGIHMLSCLNVSSLMGAGRATLDVSVPNTTGER